MIKLKHKPKLRVSQMAAAKLKQKYPDAKTPMDALTMARAELQKKLKEIECKGKIR